MPTFGCRPTNNTLKYVKIEKYLFMTLRRTYTYEAISIIIML